MKVRITLGLAILLSIIFSYRDLSSCTSILVSKGASADGSCFITDNADAGGFMDPLYFMPAMDHKAGDSVEIYEWDSGKYLGKIKQVDHTFQVIGFINENQVSVGETTYGGRPELRDTNGIIDYGSLMFLALQRSKTAREAIKIMTSLVEEYGYYSSGESFSVADPNEVWIMDFIGKGPGKKGAVWVARRVPDGYISVHANQARIRDFPLNDKENCMYAPDVITLAIEKGFYKPDSDGKFSFVNAYAPLEPGGALYCEGRVWSIFSRAAPSLNLSPDYWRAVKGAEPYPLFIKPDKKISVKDIINLNRDHFEGTEYDMTKGLAAEPFGNPCRWKPLEWKVEGDTVNSYGWERPVSTQQAAFTCIMQMRADLPREIGGVLWYGPDDNYSTCYVPLYCSMKQPPKSYITGSIKELNMESAFWVFDIVANLAYTKYSYIIKDIQKVQSELEGRFLALQPFIERTALELNKENHELMLDYLSDYSYSQAELTVERWRELWKYLVVKYNDGYINDVSQGNGRHPKGVSYSNSWLLRLLQERPGYYDVKWKDKTNMNGTK
jgi:dipeptidase